MAVKNATDSDYLLPCGRGLEQVWERLDAVESGLADEHEASCPHCAAARESLHTLRTATRELVDEPDPPPPDLFGRIMSAVRTEVRRGRTMPLTTPHPGALEVSEQAIAVVLRYAADTVDGVRARGCQVHGRGPGADGRQAIDVEMTIAVRMGGRPVGELVPLVRERVRAAASARIGLLLERVDLTVVDIYEEDR
ncbi:Asp23/Gls24 family envelope stress response protein [Nocardia sp. CDC159]|uniref:Asp23/Gls24 family envelope stress response protein n=1 Tax=Nocardia pulmonis TaxID=2951408 RepID=A0A9X2EDQ4_9NOCA|nr:MULTISPECIES: Asp23/Gls24 family envelope stress response protein [Nocardia]MCM6776338.1 Asp23/Gls24 family envelope stress response protein [Nocardia pulmonis]MCM6788762.1 Asp23/Gls24 family envelope stress response protein [Nocardia sp. CDC159]